ncbi:MAG TPA: hypothetical protein PKK26_11725 [Candidatus Wallbacteria bacterium]|nr:hypothetical protein [Candidatus Wallbacteria bacterium]
MKKNILIVALVILIFSLTVTLSAFAEDNMTPKNLTAKVKGKAVELKWNAPSGDVKGYLIKRAEGDGSFSIISFVSSTTTYLDQDVEKGKTYRYVVASRGPENKEAGTSNEVSATIKSSSKESKDEKNSSSNVEKSKRSKDSSDAKINLEAPENVKAEIKKDEETGKNYVLISWDGVEKAEGYKIYRTSDPSEEISEIGQIKKTTKFEDRKAKTEAPNFYCVAAFNKKGTGDKSQIASIAAGLQTPKIFVGLEGYSLQSNSKLFYECACVNPAERIVWISAYSQEQLKYMAMANLGTLPMFPDKYETGYLGFGVNQKHRFMFFYEPESSKVYISGNEKTNNLWGDWKLLGELQPPTGYEKGKYKFGFAVSSSMFFIVGLDTATLQTYEAIFTAENTWTPWKSTGKIPDIKTYVKNSSYYFSVMLDDNLREAAVLQPETDTLIYDTGTGSSFTSWQKANYRPQWPEWLIKGNY